MIRKMKITINGIENVVEYEGEDLNEIAKMISDDENALFDYLRSGDDENVKAFCFRGLMIRKNIIQTAQFSELDF